MSQPLAEATTVKALVDVGVPADAVRGRPTAFDAAAPCSRRTASWYHIDMRLVLLPASIELLLSAALLPARHDAGQLGTGSKTHACDCQHRLQRQRDYEHCLPCAET